MLLDGGIVTIYQQKNISQSGDMPKYEWTQVLQSFYGNKTVGINRYYTAKAQNDKIDMLIEVQRIYNISPAVNRAGIDRQYLGLEPVEGDNNIYFRILQVQQVIDEDGLKMTDISLGRIDALE